MEWDLYGTEFRSVLSLRCPGIHPVERRRDKRTGVRRTPAATPEPALPMYLFIDRVRSTKPAPFVVLGHGCSNASLLDAPLHQIGLHVGDTSVAFGGHVPAPVRESPALPLVRVGCTAVIILPVYLIHFPFFFFYFSLSWIVRLHWNFSFIPDSPHVWRLDWRGSAKKRGSWNKNCTRAIKATRSTDLLFIYWCLVPSIEWVVGKGERRVGYVYSMPASERLHAYMGLMMLINHFRVEVSVWDPLPVQSLSMLLLECST